MPVLPASPFRLRPARLLEAPDVAGISRDDEVLTVRLRGVVCGVCAARAQAAFQGIPGVEAASVDLDAGRATLRLSPGAAPEGPEGVDEDGLRQALERAAVGMPARRLVERLAGRWRRGTG